MTRSREMQKQLEELEKKLSDLQVKTQVNFARQEIEMQILKNQIQEKEKAQDSDKPTPITSSRQPLTEIYPPEPANVIPRTNLNISPVITSLDSGSEDIEVTAGPDSTHDISVSSPTNRMDFVRRLRFSPGTKRIPTPVNRARAFPRLPVSSKLSIRPSRPPPPASPRPLHSLKCPSCKKTVKKPMRLQQCPKVCMKFMFNLLDNIGIFPGSRHL